MNCNYCCECVCLEVFSSCDGTLSECCRYRPFGFCSLLSLLFNFVPWLLAWVAAFEYQDENCDAPMSTWLGVQGACHAAFIALPIYCMFRHRRLYDSTGKRKVRPLSWENKDICGRTADELLYDPGLGIAALIVCFALSWNITGHVWLNQDTCNDAILASSVISLAAMWFNIVTVFCLLFSIVSVIAFSEGTCTSGTCIKDCVYAICCMWMWPESSERQRAITQVRRESSPYQPKFLVPAFNTFRMWGVYITDKHNAENLTERALNEPTVQSITDEIRKAKKLSKPDVSAITELSMISANPFEVNLQFDEDEGSFSSRVREAQDFPNIATSHLAGRDSA